MLAIYRGYNSSSGGRPYNPSESGWFSAMYRGPRISPFITIGSGPTLQQFSCLCFRDLRLTQILEEKTTTEICVFLMFDTKS